MFQPIGVDHRHATVLLPSVAGVESDAVSFRRGFRLRACVLLSGMVRPTPMSRAIGRSVLDLPVDERRSVLDRWHDEFLALAGTLNSDCMPVRIVSDQKSILPKVPDHGETSLAFTIEQDQARFRGTGGVLHDLSTDYDDDDFILVVNAMQIMLEPLHQLVTALSFQGADVSFMSHEDGTPSGLMLVRCGVLRSISPIGFIDMKEQALPHIAVNHNVKVVQKARPSGLPIRHLSDYVKALRFVGSERIHPNSTTSLYEDWLSAFGIVEDGAEIGTNVRVHDSVVLRGARVAEGAVLVRSIVCPGARVGRRERVVDQVVTGNGNRRNGG